VHHGSASSHRTSASGPTAHQRPQSAAPPDATLAHCPVPRSAMPSPTRRNSQPRYPPPMSTISGRPGRLPPPSGEGFWEPGPAADTAPRRRCRSLREPLRVAERVAGARPVPAAAVARDDASSQRAVVVQGPRRGVHLRTAGGGHQRVRAGGEDRGGQLRHRVPRQAPRRARGGHQARRVRPPRAPVPGEGERVPVGAGVPVPVGYCEEADERLLVYEYMKNGALYGHLHPKASAAAAPSPVASSWKLRIKILLCILPYW
jgi:hypothetical protein